MATMIPAIININVKSRAERRLFSIFDRAPHTEDWIVFHSLGLANHPTKRRGEIDFLVLCPRGIIVLEVKGGRISCSNGVWTTTNRYNDTEVLKESPFDQASSAMFSLEQKLRDQLADDKWIFQLVIGYGVMFPNVKGDQDFGFTSESRLIYTEKDTHRPISIYIGRVVSFFEEKKNKYIKLNPSQIGRVKQLLQPDFDLLPTLDSVVKGTSEHLVQLTNEQYALMDLVQDMPRVLVHGAAGTGKTLLAIRAITIAASKGMKCTYLCFNKLLSNVVREHFDCDEKLKNIEVESIHSLMDRVIKQSNYSAEFIQKRNTVRSDILFGELYPEYAAMAVLDSDTFSTGFLVVDEGQDFLTNNVLDFLDSYINGGLESGRWLWFMDDNNQAALFGNKHNEALERLTRFAPQQLLTTNCRNTIQIHQETEMLTLPAQRTIARASGPPVTYLWFGSTTTQSAQLEKCLNKLLAEEINEQDIVVLSCRSKNNSVSNVQNSTLLMPINEQEPNRIKEGFVRYCSISKFKGLEADFVVLTDIENMDTEWWRSALYVGMSRAKVGLYIILPEDLRKSYSNKIEIVMREA